MSVKTATVTWLRDQTFLGEAGGHGLLMDNPVDGNDRRAPSPMELLLMALAGCAAIDVVSILKKKRQALTDLAIAVEGELVEEHPMRFARIHMTFEARGKNLSPAAVERAVQLSEEKYCSVAASLRQPVEIHSEVRVLEDETGEGTEG